MGSRSRISARGIVAGLVVVAIAAVCVRLGLWQLDRLGERRARNAAVAAALRLPPVELEGSVIARAAADPAAWRHRRVVVRGEYLNERSALLRGRGRQGAPGVHLVTPLRLPGGQALLVDRGWLPSDDAATVDPLPHAARGVVEVEGYLQPLAPEGVGDPRHAPIVVDGRRIATYQRLDLPTLRSTWQLELLPFQVVRAERPAGERAPPLGAAPPELGEGSHLGYALQWFGFAIIAITGFVVVVLRRWRRSPHVVNGS